MGSYVVVPALKYPLAVNPLANQKDYAAVLDCYRMSRTINIAQSYGWKWQGDESVFDIWTLALERGWEMQNSWLLISYSYLLRGRL